MSNASSKRSVMTLFSNKRLLAASAIVFFISIAIVYLLLFQSNPFSTTSRPVKKISYGIIICEKAILCQAKERKIHINKS